MTAYYLPDEEGKPTDVFLYQNDRYLDKVRPVVTYNRVMAEQTEEDRVAYTEQNKVLSHFSKYLNDHAIGRWEPVHRISQRMTRKRNWNFPRWNYPMICQPNCRQIRNQIMNGTPE